MFHQLIHLYLFSFLLACFKIKTACLILVYGRVSCKLVWLTSCMQAKYPNSKITAIQYSLNIACSIVSPLWKNYELITYRYHSICAPLESWYTFEVCDYCSGNVCPDSESAFTAIQYIFLWFVELAEYKQHSEELLLFNRLLRQRDGSKIFI